MIQKERVLTEFLEMVRIACSTRGEREIADYLKHKLAAIGFAVREDEVGGIIGGNAGNVYGVLKGNIAGASRILLSAHMDCVEPCAGVEPIVENGIIRSAGDTILGGDDKSGVVGILEAVRVIREQKLPHGDILVLFTVAEEGGLLGAKNLDPAGLQADIGFVLDAGGAPGKIVTSAPGQDSIRIVVHGKTAHAGGAPEEGLNAIVMAGKALAQIEDGRIDGETTANVGIIHGGRATNIVPDRVELACEARSRNLDKLAAQTKKLCSTFERVISENGGKVEIAVTRVYEPYVHQLDTKIMKIASAAAVSVGLTPAFEATGGGSDANYYNTYGVPSLVLSTGMSKVHTNEEYITEKDLYDTAEWVAAIIQKAAE